jgi:hypothetical protein
MILVESRGATDKGMTTKAHDVSTLMPVRVAAHE